MNPPKKKRTSDRANSRRQTQPASAATIAESAEFAKSTAALPHVRGSQEVAFDPFLNVPTPVHSRAGLGRARHSLALGLKDP